METDHRHAVQIASEGNNPHQKSPRWANESFVFLKNRKTGATREIRVFERQRDEQRQA